ncbi:hypothetical protein [Catenuloplanes japonicus]|uniref:hypothetical protein n=1 Tax=Catenuloplanes japonicus TaxID=33876 RepID=UPI0005244F3C|nr:hypothetical protein [Catenuloplanes japonicus]
MIELDGTPEPQKEPRWGWLWAYPLVVVLIAAVWLGVRGRAEEEMGEEFTAHVAVQDEVHVAAGEVRLRGVATVTNVDDEAAVVHAVHAEWPGVRIAMNEERPHRMSPGGTAPMGVTITMTCVHDALAGAVGRAVVDRSPGGDRGEVDLPITAARPWPVMRLKACEVLAHDPAG